MINKIILLVKRMMQDKRMRFLGAAGFNFAAGYLISLAMYYSLEDYLNIVVIAVIINIICITVSFLTYKLFVFRTKGGWIREYLRCYVVYGGTALIGTGGLWLLVEKMEVQFWLAQGGLMIFLAVFSFIGHNYFSFARKKNTNSLAD